MKKGFNCPNNSITDQWLIFLKEKGRITIRAWGFIWSQVESSSLNFQSLDISHQDIVVFLWDDRRDRRKTRCTIKVTIRIRQKPSLKFISYSSRNFAWRGERNIILCNKFFNLIMATTNSSMSMKETSVSITLGKI